MEAFYKHMMNLVLRKMKYVCKMKKMNIGRLLLMMLIFIFLLSSCFLWREYYTCNPKDFTKDKTEYWEYILKQTEYNDIKIFTMITFDKLLISKELKNKYYLDILYRQSNKDSIIYLVIIHEGYDLLFVEKSSISLYLKADSHNYKLTADKTNRDDGAFTYQSFAFYDFTVQQEKIYYRVTLQELENIIYADNIYIKLIGEKHSWEGEVPIKATNYLQKFYRKIIIDQKK